MDYAFYTYADKCRWEKQAQIAVGSRVKFNRRFLRNTYGIACGEIAEMRGTVTSLSLVDCRFVTVAWDASPEPEITRTFLNNLTLADDPETYDM